ncbi:ATP-binding protein [Nocardioides sambongensis]|uniref:ATP-binding protein n=1 Tax=Nocardioides sambongensis TaxID=2589074 RepID=UPI0015E82E1F|nr:ATP-binding protein [Nocardioides sambongensis]
MEVWLLVDRDAVEVRVRDNGPGVPADLAGSVFVRGFSTKPDLPGGRGIGLALARMVCRRRGGDVTLSPARPDSDLPGAEFRAVLPLAAAERQDAPGTEVTR